MQIRDKKAMSRTGLSFFDRFLTLWIVLAMGLGMAVGFFAPGFSEGLSELSIGPTSIPLAVGLILMMYPPLAKVRYEELRGSLHKGKLLTLSLVMNWIVGPVLMTLLALVFLRDYPGYMVGVILVGLARCIAMVIVWNDLARGNRELGVGLVAFNAVFQILFYAAYMYLFINLFLNQTGLAGSVHVDISFWDAAITVLTYLGIPFAAGFVSRFVLIRVKGKEWYETRFLPRISPLTPLFLLFTIVVMFAFNGSYFVSNPLDVVMVAIPYLIYFGTIWIATLLIARALGANYEDSTAVAFSAASNDFELAIAVAIAVWGVGSAQAFAAVVGPLIEVPIMMLLVKLGQALKPRLWIRSSLGVKA